MRKLCGLVLFSTLWVARAHAQTAADPMAWANPQFLNCSTGICNPLGGGTVTTYIAGTTTPLATCASSALTGSACTTPNSNPIQLNSSGFNAAGSGNAGIWPLPTRCYKFLLKDSDGATVWTQDNVCNRAGILQASLAGPNGATLVGFQPTNGTVPLTVASALNSTIIDTGYSTLALACSSAAAAGKTLIVTKSWAPSSFTCAAPLLFVAGGMIAPASSSTVIIKPNFTCGAYQRCFDLSASSSLIAFSSAPDHINPNWYGADWIGANDSTAALVAAIAAAQLKACTMYVPQGSYKHTGLTSSGDIRWEGSESQRSILIYTGTGTGITLTTPGGIISNIRFQSSLGWLTASVGMDLRFASELTMNHVAFGGAPASGFQTCMRFRVSNVSMDDPLFSWCGVSNLLDLDIAANNGIVINRPLYYQFSAAAIKLSDTGPFSVKNGHFEAGQNVILVDNTASSVVVSGPITIEGNGISFQNEDGQTYTNPKVINLNGNNVSNTIVATNINVLRNNVGSVSSQPNCNILSKTASAGGPTWSFYFEGNTWAGCTDSVVHGDLDSINLTYSSEFPPGGVPEFTGAMNGQEILKTIAHPTAPAISACGGSPALSASSNDRAGHLSVGSGSVSSCTITFGTPFVNFPNGGCNETFNFGGGSTPPYSCLPAFSGGAWVGFVLTGTNLAATQWDWSYPLAQ